LNGLDNQKAYWDSVAAEKIFTHPVRPDVLRDMVPLKSRILDCGCGYGRTCSELADSGYRDIVGVDTSAEMIRRGLALYPGLSLQHIDSGGLPFPDNEFDACILFAVLTCVPTDRGQTALISELHRVVRSGGIIYLSDYPLQGDDRNNERYDAFEAVYGARGVFRLADGCVVRHHAMSWIYELLSQFDIVQEETGEVSTMNGNAAKIFQIVAKKR